MTNTNKSTPLHNTTLYLEHFQLRQNPFRQEPDPELFFPEGGRAEMFDHLLADIIRGEPLINLTGSEGVGKTLLYLLLAREVSPDTFDLVCLDHPVGSFEDLLRIICHALRTEPYVQTTASQPSYLPEFVEHLRARRNEGRRVLLLVDEAEKLFLATLERLVRLICDPDAGDVLQILLIGRSQLEKNIEQLVIYCSNVDVKAGYVLNPLTQSETERYLRFRLKRAGTPGDKHRAIFSAEAVSEIYREASGNISLTNMLAEKSLKLACEAGMFSVDGMTLNPLLKKDRPALSGVLAFMSRLRGYRPWLLALAVLILLFFLFFFRPEEKQETPPEQPQNQVEQKNIGAAAGSAPEISDGEILPPATPAEQPGPSFGAGTDRPSASPVEAGLDAPVAVPDIPFPGEERLLVIQPGARKKKGPAPQPAPEEATEGGEPARDGDLLFEERLRATSSWLAWSYRGGFTIQLMVLASDTAEESLKNLLVQDDYYSIRDDLYIMRKASSPALLVFYGLYDTMEEARRIRDALPEFLRSHQPYALSIDEALKKTEQ